jgi:hypothetical protein
MSKLARPVSKKMCRFREAGSASFFCSATSVAVSLLGHPTKSAALSSSLGDNSINVYLVQTNTLGFGF